MIILNNDIEFIIFNFIFLLNSIVYGHTGRIVNPI